MSPSARAMVMNAMPVSAGHVVAGTILHFAFAAFLGLAFAAVIGAAAWVRVPGLRTPGGIISAGVIGGAIVYVIMRWGLLPPVNPLMAFVPQTAFFLAHLLFGLVAGIVLAIAFRRPPWPGRSPPAGNGSSLMAGALPLGRRGVPPPAMPRERPCARRICQQRGGVARMQWPCLIRSSRAGHEGNPAPGVSFQGYGRISGGLARRPPGCGGCKNSTGTRRLRRGPRGWPGRGPRWCCS
jgi:hypothetical protein